MSVYGSLKEVLESSFLLLMTHNQLYLGRRVVGGRTTDRFLEFIDIKIERSHTALIGYFSIRADQVETVGPGYILFLGFILHIVQQHWERKIIAEHTGRCDFSALVRCCRLFKNYVLVQITEDLIFSLSMGFANIDAKEFNFVSMGFCQFIEAHGPVAEWRSGVRSKYKANRSAKIRG